MASTERKPVYLSKWLHVAFCGDCGEPLGVGHTRETAYARATQLDPENRFYRAFYLDFQRRTAKSATGGPG